MADGSISQNELDSLFGTLEELPDTTHIWIIKSKYGSVFGGRNYSLWQAQNLLSKVQKEHPGVKAEIKQIK